MANPASARITSGVDQAGEKVTWLEGRCISFGQSIPFLPVIDQLRENFGIEEFDGEPEIIAKVEHGMRRLGRLEAYIPYIRYLLSVDPGDPAIAALDPLVRRKQCLMHYGHLRCKAPAYAQWS